MPALARPHLRPGLLEGRSVAVAGASSAGGFGRATADAGSALGAAVAELEIDPAGDEERVATLVADTVGGPLELLAWDGAGAFAGAGEPSVAAVRAALDGAWLAVRAVAQHAMIPREHGGGKLLLIAPPPGGAHAAAARAGLENMARTLSIEWARFAVRPVALHPGPATAPEEAGQLAAYLASPAGDYFSGCVLRLGAA